MGGYSEHNNRPTAEELRRKLDIAKEDYHSLGKSTTVCIITLQDGRECAGVNTYWGRQNDESRARDMAFRKAGRSALNALELARPVRRGR